MLFVEIMCDYPPTVTHGHLLDITGYKVAHAAKYECDDGYVMRGYDAILCQPYGNWSVAPTCIFGKKYNQKYYVGDRQVVLFQLTSDRLSALFELKSLSYMTS